MTVTRREMVGLSAAAMAGWALGKDEAAPARYVPPPAGPSFAYDRDVAEIRHPLVREAVRFTVITDSHFAFIDDRDAAWKGHAARMAQWPGKEAHFDAAVAAAKKHGAEFLPLTGDMISFPSLANVEFLRRKMSESGLECRYVAGNHDWHFEGVEGSDGEQRAKWIPARLLPLYDGRDPLAYSVVKKGVRFVFVDDSAYFITPEQFAFLRRELATGDPVCLFLHIPLHLSSRSSIGTLAHPAWGAATDRNWEVERRRKWPAEGPTPVTFAFRELALSAPNMVGVFAGHEHILQVGSARGVPQFIVPSCNGGRFLNVVVRGV